MSTSVRPKPGAVRPYDFPAVHRETLRSGLRLVVAPMHRLPLVTVLALVDAGATADPHGLEGVAALTARTLSEGTGALDGAAVSARFEALGTSFEASADWDSIVARVTATTERAPAALALFAQVLRAPAFPEGDVARKRDERIADLAQLISEPRGLADVRFTGTLYESGSRYARPLGGTARSVAPLSAAHVRAFHDRHFGPSTTTILVVGDCTVAAARAMVLEAFGDWQARATPAAPIEARQAPGGRRTIIVAKPDAPQSELRVGHVGVPRRHPDHLALVVMNAILGGLFSSRLNLNLRERNAFTYGASSGFDWRRAAGPFVASSAVRSDVTARAVEEMLREIDAMRAAPPAEAEVTLATDYLAGVFPIRYENTAAVAGALAGAIAFGLPDDWFSTYRDRVQAIDAAAVHAAARAHLDPDRLLVLAVGDPATIEAPLAALGHADVQVRAATDDPTEAE